MINDSDEQTLRARAEFAWHAELVDNLKRQTAGMFRRGDERYPQLQYGALGECLGSCEGLIILADLAGVEIHEACGRDELRQLTAACDRQAVRLGDMKRESIGEDYSLLPQDRAWLARGHWQHADASQPAVLRKEILIQALNELFDHEVPYLQEQLEQMCRPRCLDEKQGVPELQSLATAPVSEGSALAYMARAVDARLNPQQLCDGLLRYAPQLEQALTFIPACGHDLGLICDQLQAIDEERMDFEFPQAMTQAQREACYETAHQVGDMIRSVADDPEILVRMGLAVPGMKAGLAEAIRQPGVLRDEPRPAQVTGAGGRGRHR